MRCSLSEHKKLTTKKLQPFSTKPHHQHNHSLKCLHHNKDIFAVLSKWVTIKIFLKKTFKYCCLYFFFCNAIAILFFRRAQKSEKYYQLGCVFSVRRRRNQQIIAQTTSSPWCQILRAGRVHTTHKQSFRETRAAHTQHAKILTTTNFVLLSSSSRKPQGRTQRNAATRGHNVNMFFSVYGAGACASFAASLRILQ